MQSTSKTNLQALKPKQNFPLRTLSKVKDKTQTRLVMTIIERELRPYFNSQRHLTQRVKMNVLS